MSIQVDLDYLLDKADSVIIEDDLEDRDSVYQNVSFINEFSSSIIEEIVPSINIINNISPSNIKRVKRPSFQLNL